MKQDALFGHPNNEKFLIWMAMIRAQSNPVLMEFRTCDESVCCKEASTSISQKIHPKSTSFDKQIPVISLPVFTIGCLHIGFCLQVWEEENRKNIDINQNFSPSPPKLKVLRMRWSQRHFLSWMKLFKHRRKTIRVVKDIF